MLGISLGGNVPQGVNIQAVTIWIYKTYFLAAGDKGITGISSKIKIDRKTNEMSQLGKSE